MKKDTVFIFLIGLLNLTCNSFPDKLADYGYLMREANIHEVLDIYGHGITKDNSHNLLKFTNLKFLIINDSNLSQLPSGINKLKQLRVLNLRRNKLDKLPKEIVHLKKLNHLYLSGNQLKSLPKKDSLYNLIGFSKKTNNRQKLPKRVIEFLINIESNLEEIRTIRDLIIHKGKEIIITQSNGQMFIRIPKKDMYNNDNILPNILNSSEINYNMNDYLRAVTKSFFKLTEDLGLIILSELIEKEKFNLCIYSISNYCMDEFTCFLLNFRKSELAS